MTIEITDIIISIMFYAALFYFYKSHIEKNHKKVDIKEIVPNQKVNEILDDLKRIRGYNKILTNVIVQNKKRIDILLIHETGIYIIEHKKDIGDIYGKEFYSHWIQKEKGLFGLYKKHKIPNPIKENQENVLFIKNMFRKEIPIFSYLTYKNECELNRLDYTLFKQEVRVVRRNDVSSIVRVRSLNREKVLTPEEINALYELFYPLTELPINITM